MKLQRPDETIAAYRKAIALSPTCRTAQQSRRALTTFGRNDEAIAACPAAIQIQPICPKLTIIWVTL